MILGAIRINDDFFVLIADRPREFFRPSLMIAASKKTYIKDKAELIAAKAEAWKRVISYRAGLFYEILISLHLKCNALY